MSTVEQFQSWRDNRHDYAREWKKKTGGKVIGYFCTYVPEEIIYAAGMLPVRILGSHEPQDVTEPHIFSMFCPFCRDCLAQGLKGRFDYLDGIMIAQSCLHIRQAFTSWKHHIPVDFSYYLPMPHHVQSPSSKPFLLGELEQFRSALESWSGKKITDEALGDAIEATDENRRLMKQVYEARKADNPPVTGLEALYMVLASQMVDKKEHSATVTQFLEELPKRKLNRQAGTRLMIVGSEDDDTQFFRMVESVGATIVVDDHCTGTRAFWDESKPTGNPLQTIANRYVDRTPCPTKDWPQRLRFDRILEFAKGWDVKGAIIIQQKFCDPHECDIPPLTWKLKDNGFPSLFLEFDVTVPYGQFRTRVEAFLETLGEEDLF
ncbi:MAG: benzoyl-CoA reductase, bzd-type, subunit N [Chloroflexi bacterium]|nr:benzoyl-CoA reductase, bzd-type, subunit N [Chloroflexota bacterium]